LDKLIGNEYRIEINPDDPEEIRIYDLSGEFITAIIFGPLSKKDLEKVGNKEGVDKLAKEILAFEKELDEEWDDERCTFLSGSIEDDFPELSREQLDRLRIKIAIATHILNQKPLSLEQNNLQARAARFINSKMAQRYLESVEKRCFPIDAPELQARPEDLRDLFLESYQRLPDREKRYVDEYFP